MGANRRSEVGGRLLKKRRNFIVYIVIIVLVGVGLYVFRDRITDTSAGGSRSATDAAVTATVPVQRRTIIHTITATGNVQPARQVDLRFSRTGRVQEVNVSAGERVEEGQLLATLDNREPELAYFRARNAYEISQIDSAPNVVREKEIDMELSRDALEQTYLRAPFDGIVTEVDIEPGQSLGANDVVVQLVDDSAFEVQVSVDELDIARVATGQQVTIRLDADPNTVREGVVERVSLVANTSGNVVTVPVTVRFLEPDEFLRPGYTATLQIIVAQSENALVVPVEAIWEDGPSRTVTRVAGGEQETVAVTTGLSDGAWVEIVSGLNEGDEVIALNYRGGPAAGGRSGGSGSVRIPGGVGVGVPMRMPSGR